MVPNAFDTLVNIKSCKMPESICKLSQVENEYCRRVIHARIQDGLVDAGMVFSDICALKAEQLPEDIIGYFAGFPCQAWLLM